MFWLVEANSHWLLFSHARLLTYRETEWKPLFQNIFRRYKAMTNQPIAGFDVSKYFSEMCVLTPDNKVFARMKVHHNVADMKKACSILKNAEKEFGMIPSLIMEATGHYHRLLFHFLKNAGYEVVVVNPIQTDSIKNIGVRKVKNDKIDAYRIALLYRLKELHSTNMPVDAVCDIRSLCRQYHDLSDDLTVYKNRLVAILDQIFPGFQHIFGKVSSCTALEVLSRYPTPDALLAASNDELVRTISSVSRKGLKWAIEKCNRLIELAHEVQPLFIRYSSNIHILNTTIQVMEALQRSLKTVESQIVQIIRSNPVVLGQAIGLLCTIPGIDTIIAATILGEIGDLTAFKSPKQLVAFFGIDPTLKDSGQFKSSRNKMSKRGSKYLRRVLYTSAMVSVSRKRNNELNNPVLLEYYKNKCLSKPKKVALVAVMHKLVYIIFAVLRDQKPFELRSPEQHKQLLISRSKKQHTSAA